MVDLYVIMNHEPNTTSSNASLERPSSKEIIDAKISHQIEAVHAFNGGGGLIEVLDGLSKDELIRKEDDGYTATILIAHIALTNKIIKALESKKYSEEEIKQNHTDGFTTSFGMRKKVDELIEDWYRKNLDIDLSA